MPSKPVVEIVTVAIAEGESLSAVANTTTGSMFQIDMPADWTPANLTFQVSPDNDTFNDLVDNTGREIMIACRAGTSIVLAQFAQIFAPIAYLKLRSGSRDYPVPQEAARDFILSIAV